MFEAFLSKDKKSKAEIFEILYPKEVYKDARLRLVFFRARKIVLDFIAQSSKTELDNFAKTHRYLQTKKADSLSNKLIKQNVDRLDLSQHSYNYQLELDIANTESESIIAKGNRSIEPKLEASHRALDNYYFVEKLKLACNTANYSRLSGYVYDLKFLDPVISFLTSEDLGCQPLLYLYFHTYQMIVSQSEAEFESVFSYLQTNTIFENEDYREILISCLNFCIQKINRGQHEYAIKTLDVYKLMLRSKNIYVENKLPSNTYKNIAILGLRLKQYEWTLQFIEIEKTKLQSKYPTEDYQLVKARYHYELEEYDKCIQLILQSRPTDILDSLQFRVLQCKAYYELDDYEQLDNALQNAKIFLLRHKSKAYQLRIYANFFKALYKLLHYNYSKKSELSLSKAIVETQPIAEKQWLEEKRNSLTK